jgi:hypothetical protein
VIAAGYDIAEADRREAQGASLALAFAAGERRDGNRFILDNAEGVQRWKD